MKFFPFLLLLTIASLAESVPPLKKGAVLALDEDCSGGIDSEKWDVMRRHWEKGHDGVVPENVKGILKNDQPNNIGPKGDLLRAPSPQS